MTGYRSGPRNPDRRRVGRRADRLASFHKLQAEAEWQARKDDPIARQEEVSRYKAIMKSMKAHPKYRR